MPAKKPRKLKKGRVRTTRGPILDDELLPENQDEEPIPTETRSMTALAAEALRTGVSPHHLPHKPPPIPKEEKIKSGDPDVDVLNNEYTGEEVPGGTTPTPDQNRIDDIGRAYGVTEEDSGALQTSDELLRRRDQKMHGIERPAHKKKRS